MGYQGKPEKNNKKHNPDDGALCYLIDAIIASPKIEPLFKSFSLLNNKKVIWILKNHGAFSLKNVCVYVYSCFYFDVMKHSHETRSARSCYVNVSIIIWFI